MTDPMSELNAKPSTKAFRSVKDICDAGLLAPYLAAQLLRSMPPKIQEHALNVLSQLAAACRPHVQRSDVDETIADLLVIIDDMDHRQQ